MQCGDPHYQQYSHPVLAHHWPGDDTNHRYSTLLTVVTWWPCSSYWLYWLTKHWVRSSKLSTDSSVHHWTRLPSSSYCWPNIKHILYGHHARDTCCNHYNFFYCLYYHKCTETCKKVKMYKKLSSTEKKPRPIYAMVVSCAHHCYYWLMKERYRLTTLILIGYSCLWIVRIIIIKDPHTILKMYQFSYTNAHVHFVD